jgi:hypothetical protein
MIKVKNDRVMFTLSKNGKVIKTLDFTNRLTNLYLDYVLSKHIGKNYVVDNDTIEPFFSFAYIKFDDTQVITDASTTMLYDVKSSTLNSTDIDITVGDNSKTMTINYFIDLTTIPDGSVLKGIGFGRDDSVNTDWLLSFIDLSLTGLTKEDNIAIGVTRFDEITSNEMATSGLYLPFTGVASDDYGVLNKIRIEFEDGSYDDYPLTNNWKKIEATNFFKVNSTTIEFIDPFSDDRWTTYFAIGDSITISDGTTQEVRTVANITNNGFYLVLSSATALATINTVLYETIRIRRISTGYAQLIGFNNFYEGLGLFPSDTLYPSTTLYPTTLGQPIKVYFTYDLVIGGEQTTYLLIQDLDTSYNDTALSINVKIERGDY